MVGKKLQNSHWQLISLLSAILAVGEGGGGEVKVWKKDVIHLQGSVVYYFCFFIHMTGIQWQGPLIMTDIQ